MTKYPIRRTVVILGLMLTIMALAMIGYYYFTGNVPSEAFWAVFGTIAGYIGGTMNNITENNNDDSRTTPEGSQGEGEEG